MKIVCDSCGTKYSIADEKVRGKVFKIRCKKCSHIIVVRGLTPADHDDVAALLAPNLEDLAANLFVGDRILGPARVTNDLHQRLDSEGAHPKLSRCFTEKGNIILRPGRHASQAAPVSQRIQPLSSWSKRLRRAWS